MEIYLTSEYLMLRPWQLEMEIDRESNTSIHIQIAQQIINEIQLGRFPIGMALPGTRGLANKLNINRKTVVQAYEELISQGWLNTESKRGTFVSSKKISSVNSLKPATKETNYKIKSSLTNDVSTYVNKRYENDIIHFSSGLSDSRLIPLDVLSRAMRHALIVTARSNKQSYIEPNGPSILREAITQMLNMGRGMRTETSQICVVRGGQMGIFLSGRVLLRYEDNVVMTKLCDQLVCDAFKSCGANIHYLPQDENGLDLIALEQLCKTKKIRIVYVNPHHQVPTLVTMPLVNRRMLLALAEQYDFLIIEDDHDYEFHFSSKQLQPLASMDKYNRVIYIGTLSKILAPGFRLGFIAAPKEITKHLANEIMMIDRQGNLVTELAIAELMHIGEINRHTLKVIKIYEERRAQIIDLIKLELGQFVMFKVPNGGLSLWLEVDKQIDMQRLVKDAELEKVRIVTGAEFSEDNKQIHAICLGFANLTSEEAKTGILRLKKAFLRQVKSYMN